VEGTLKESLSRDLRLSQKKWRWRKYGMKLEVAVASWLARDFGWGFDVVWDTVGNIDVRVQGLKVEIECKRLNKTQFVTRGWLEEHVTKRFSPDAWMKVLVTTKVCWTRDDDKFLAQNGIEVIDVGPIDTKSELERAKARFITQFLELLFERWKVEMLREEA
jgi:hypothetical protein